MSACDCHWCAESRRDRRASFLGGARKRLRLARAEARQDHRAALIAAARTFRAMAHEVARESVSHDEVWA